MFSCIHNFMIAESLLNVSLYCNNWIAKLKGDDVFQTKFYTTVTTEHITKVGIEVIISHFQSLFNFLYLNKHNMKRRAFSTQIASVALYTLSGIPWIKNLTILAFIVETFLITCVHLVISCCDLVSRGPGAVLGHHVQYLLCCIIIIKKSQEGI